MKFRFFKKSLRSHAAIWSASSCLLLGLPLFVILYVNQKSSYEERLLSDAKENVEKASSFILGYFYGQNNWMHLEETQKHLNHVPSVVYSYVVGEGKKIDLGINGLDSFDNGESSHAWEPEVDFDLKKTKLVRFRASKELTDRINSSDVRAGEELALIAAPIYCPTPGTNCAQLRTVITFRSIQSELDQLALSFASVLIAFSLLIGYVVYNVVKKFLTPVHVISGKIAGLDAAKNATESIEVPLSDKYEETRLLNAAFHRSAQVFAEASAAKSDLTIAKRVGEMATQVAHDIRSPLAALDLVASDLSTVSEERRIILRSAVGRIKDIANNLLAQNKSAEELMEFSLDANTPHLICSLVEKIVSEKRIQHRSKLGVEIITGIDAASYGLFAKIDSTEFKRIISNLIDNSVEAIKDSGIIEISVSGNDHEVLVAVSDNGVGISGDILPKLTQKGASFNKENGNGLGLYHARNTIESFGGSLSITSEISKGTTVTLHMPRSNAPKWFVPRLTLRNKMSIVVVDDDSSVHQIWQKRLNRLNACSHEIEAHHFTSPTDASDWITKNSDKISSTLFLMDFELLGHAMSGLDLMAKHEIQSRCILVTSHFEECNVRKRCEDLGVRLIPKSIAGFVPMEIDSDARVDAVLLDDDKLVHQIWKSFAKKNGKDFRTFFDKESFFQGIKEIDRSSPIYLDSNLGDGIRGQDLVDDVRELGFEKIYLTTGYSPEKFAAVKGFSGIVDKNPPESSSGDLA